MQYEMRNFIKFSKKVKSNVGLTKKYSDEWKRKRKIQRQAKLKLQLGTINYKSKVG